MSGERLRQIGEVAERVDLSLRTLRYWGEIGLAAPSARSEGGFRLYSERDVERILLLKEMKPLGLTLEEMAALAELLERAEEPVDESDAAAFAEALSAYAERADGAIEKLERQLGWARALRGRIGGGLDGISAALAQPGSRTSGTRQLTRPR
jgi:DNA-binding transcriptional MerR regulator